MSAPLEFRVLGPLEVRLGDAAVDVGSRRQRALLARLALDVGRPVSTARLIDDLWGERPPESAPALLQTYVSRLRRALEPERRPGAASILASDGSAYVLRAQSEQVDAHRFEALTEQGHAALAEGRFDDAHRTLADALALWRGHALADLTHDGFADPASSRLEGLRLSAIEDQTEAALALGRHDALAATLPALVAAHPLRERMRAQLVLALYRAGRQADALAAIREARKVMLDELGIEPSPRLRQLETMILRQDPELDWSAPAAREHAEPASVTATFLFTDVEGSTRLLQRLGDERFGAVIATHDRVIRETFARHGGREADSQGDSFFFVFPDAPGAVLAAVEAQRALAQEQWPDGIRLRVRMGLHTGEASLVEGKCMGIAVHRAARVSDAGHGGQILLSQATAGLVEDDVPVALRNLGEHRLKDLERPLRLFQVVAQGLASEFPPVRALAGSRELPTGRPAGGLTFVGRERELGILTEALEDTLTGTGRIALLRGEAGIGKSRLALELANVAAERGTTLLWGTCHEGGVAPALWPWVQVVRLAVDLLPEAERKALPPELAQLLPELGGTAPQAADADAPFRLYDAAATTLASVAHRQPLLVVLDDLHWADASTLELLQTLALHVVSLPVLLLATYREDEPGAVAALTRPLAVIGRYPWTRHVVLRGLPHDAVRQVIRDTAEIEPPRGLVAAVHARTDGNPFFVSELVRLLASESDLGAERVLYAGIPLGVRDVVRRRLQSLPPRTQELLQLAAAIGRSFSFELLADVSGSGDPAACAELLEPALETRVVVAGDEEDYRFSHGIVRETIVEDLTPLRRARLHMRLADGLLERFGNDDDHAELVAEHVWQGRQLTPPARAVPVLEQAAAVALRRHAYAAGDGLLERALELARRLPAAERDAAQLRIELELASLRMMTQGYSSPAVIAGFERVLAIARRSGRLWEVVKAAHGIASGFAVGGQFWRSLEVARQGLAAAEELDEPLALSIGHLIVGIARMHLGDIAEARRHFASTISEYERVRDEEPDAFELAVPVGLAGPVFSSVMEWIGGDAEAARGRRRRAVEVIEELDTPFAWQVGMFWCGFLAALEDDPAGCLAYVERGQAAAGELVFPVYEAVLALLAAWARARGGDVSAVAELRSVLIDLDRSGVLTLSHFFRGLYADAVAATADEESALEAFEDAIATSHRLDERFYLAELRRRRGELLLALGREAEGVAELEAALALAAKQGARALEERARETLATRV